MRLFRALFRWVAGKLAEISTLSAKVTIDVIVIHQFKYPYLANVIIILQSKREERKNVRKMR